ncbi:MAG: YeeE/YedE family protein [Polaromonas sp.]
MLKKTLFALAAGLLFAFGLVLSGMTQPAKVVGFLHLAGLSQGISWQAAPGFWDPSLALVMRGALMVTLIAFAVTPQKAKPWADDKFHLPTRQDIDGKLLTGAALFGIGWGLAGYCPGPGFAALLSGGLDAAAFVVALLVGMWGAKRWLV